MSLNSLALLPVFMHVGITKLLTLSIIPPTDSKETNILYIVRGDTANIVAGQHKYTIYVLI